MGLSDPYLNKKDEEERKWTEREQVNQKLKAPLYVHWWYCPPSGPH